MVAWAARCEPPLFDDSGGWIAPPSPWPDVVPRSAVLAALDSLEPRERMVVALRDLVGLTAAEAAAALGLDEDAEHALLRRGRTSLRAELDRLV
jgi:DNA-directed RNA polymerase specialized sigma24 family protein